MAIFMDKWLFLGQNTGRWSGPKYVNFWVKILILWQGGPRAVSPTCKLSDVSYRISLHGKTCIRTICALKTHPCGIKGVQNVTMKKTKRFKKTNTKTKVFQTPNVCYAFEKQGVQGCQIWQFLFGKLGIKILIHCGWRGCCIACAQDAHNIVLVSSIDEIINNRKAGSLSLSLYKTSQN